ncbi:MAG: hypothetical protein AAGI01_13185, partial [Myxococcota bacterium]
MNVFTSHHATLLAALRGERLVPRLYARLSLERYAAREEELKRLVDWPDELSRGPGWVLLEPALDQPQAWPQVWHEAVERGFSSRADHHHALLFTRLTERFVEDEEYEHAHWSWAEALGAWSRVLESPYAEELFLDLVAEDADEDARSELRASLEGLLVPMISRRARALGLALRIDDGEARPSPFDRRVVRSNWAALELVRELWQGREDPLGALACAAAEAEGAQGRIVLEVLSRFERIIEGLDLSVASG